MAQLGARFHGMEKVVSSNLTRSTKFIMSYKTAKTVKNFTKRTNYMIVALPSIGLDLALSMQ
jgi:hypothetical protein